MRKVIINTLIFTTIGFCLVGCGKNLPYNYEKVDGINPTCVSDGYKDYYYSKNHNTYAEDEEGKIVIKDIETWKNIGGDGYLPIDSKAHRIYEDLELAPTFSEKGHISGFTCELCEKHFTSIDASTEIPDKDWYIAVKSATEITKGMVYLKYKSSDKDISDLYVEGVDLSTFELRGSNNKELSWSTLDVGSEINVYLVKDESVSYKARAIVYREYENLAPGMKAFLNLEDNKTADYLYKYSINSGTVGNPTGVKLKWTNTSKESQTLVVSTNKDLSDPIYEEELNMNDSSKILYNLIPHTLYYAKVTSASGEEIYKDVFRLYGDLRCMNVTNVYNMRDVGGYMTESGKRVNYGLLYRSGKFDDINEKGKSDLAKLGVKTDLELRYDAGTTSKVENLNYVKAPLYHWGHCFPNAVPGTAADQTSLAGMKLAIQTLSKSANYPVDIHCSGGADRTGTVVFVILGLLGVSYEDMAREFELTTFSTYGLRLRASVSLIEGTYQYDLTSSIKDQSGFVPSFQIVYNHIKNNYLEDGESFSDGIEKYLLNDIKVTQTEIDSIKEIFLGK